MKTDVEYWNEVASSDEPHDPRCTYIRSNPSKSRIVMRELLRHEYNHKRILEIGVGCGTIAAAINLIYVGNVKYVGIDISEAFINVATRIFRLNVKNARSTNIPFEDGLFDYVWMFDVFEHILPEERERTGKEIGRVLKKGGMLIMNSPVMPTLHDEGFDFGIVKSDIDGLMKNAAISREYMNIIHYMAKDDPMRAYVYEEFRK